MSVCQVSVLNSYCTISFFSFMKKECGSDKQAIIKSLIIDQKRKLNQYDIIPMPLFYHIHRSAGPSRIETEIVKDWPLFLSRKGSFWYNLEKLIGMEQFGGYRIYEICIPRDRFTYSFRPIVSGRIVKVTGDNVDEYVRLKNKYPGSINFFNELRKRNIIGYDATSARIQSHASASTRFHTPELAIFDFTNYHPVINIVESRITKIN